MQHAIILAAGLGTRLSWLTHKHPKALMMIQGEPAIVHVIRRLSRQGIRHIVINTHHHGQQLIQTLGNGDAFGVHLSFSSETDLLDSGGGVRTAMQYLPEGVPFVVHNADVMSDMDIQALARRCPASGAALGMVPNPTHHPDGDFAYQAGILALQGSPRCTFSGISVWQASIFAAYPTQQAFALSSIMRPLIAQQRCAALIHRGAWFDIGRPKDLLRARKYWRNP